MDTDFDYSDLACPACAAEPTHYRYCNECDDGYSDEHEADPINFAPGESFRLCTECWGSGNLHWCPNCGEDISFVFHALDEWREMLRYVDRGWVQCKSCKASQPPADQCKFCNETEIVNPKDNKMIQKVITLRDNLEAEERFMNDR